MTLETHIKGVVRFHDRSGLFAILKPPPDDESGGNSKRSGVIEPMQRVYPEVRVNAVVRPRKLSGIKDMLVVFHGKWAIAENLRIFAETEACGVWAGV